MTVVPSIASVAGIETTLIEVGAVALEALVLGDLDLDVEVAGRRAGLAGVAGAGDPQPLAVFDPGRDLDRVGPLAGVRPLPPHSAHGVSGILPAPPQASQATPRTICPNGVRATWRSWPAPPQRSQVAIGVPGSAPLPWQCSQAPTASKATSRRTPVETSVEVELGGDEDVAARCRAARRRSRSAAPPPKSAWRMSSIEPKPEAPRGSKPPERRPSCP